MSSKSKRPGKKVNLAPPMPRELSQIEEDYGRLVSQSGQAQYQVFVYTEDLKRINEQLRNLNYEAAARNKLDAELKAAQIPAPAAAEEKQVTQ